MSKKQPITKKELEEELGSTITEFEIYLKNVNSILYMYTLNGTKYIFKQNKSKDRDIQEEYETLKKINEMKKNKFKVPVVRNLLLNYEGYVMEYIEGLTLSQIIAQENFDKINSIVKQLGESIAMFHNCFSSQNKKQKVNQNKILPISKIKKNDKQNIERISFIKKNIIDKIYVEGIIHGDLDPQNIIISNDEFYLIDISPLHENDFLMKDLGTFLAGIEKENIRNLNKITKQQLEIINKSFVQSYFNAQKKIKLNKDIDIFIKIHKIDRLINFYIYQDEALSREKNYIKKVKYLYSKKKLDKIINSSLKKLEYKVQDFKY